MTGDVLRVACLQMCSVDDRIKNLHVAKQLLNAAASSGTQLAVLPENFFFMGSSDESKRSNAEYFEDSSALSFLSEQAERHRMAIIGGSILLKQRDSDLLRNTSAVFSSTGKLLATYDKIHLFDVDLGPELYRESDLIMAGAEPKVVNLESWRIGLSICYDLRFPELYRFYSSQGCQILSIPSAFTIPTGMSHWETLLRARAIENQAYVLAPGQSGEHPGGRCTWGHSMIIDPWGDILACKDAGEGFITAELDMSRVKQVQKMVPALKNRQM